MRLQRILFWAYSGFNSVAPLGYTSLACPHQSSDAMSVAGNFLSIPDVWPQVSQLAPFLLLHCLFLEASSLFFAHKAWPKPKPSFPQPLSPSGSFAASASPPPTPLSGSFQGRKGAKEWSDHSGSPVPTLPSPTQGLQGLLQGREYKIHPGPSLAGPSRVPQPGLAGLAHPQNHL